MTSSAAPRLTVVVTIVDGGDALAGLLEALASQHDAPTMEVLVAWDDSAPEVATLAARFPGVHFIAMGPTATASPVASAAGQHELFDRRRTAALRHASGSLIGILEDRVRPTPTWAATMTRLHDTLPHGVIGGAIAPGMDDAPAWSIWAVDYGRYAPPFEAGARDWVSDVNVCYKRHCIEATRAIWEERYNEARVHWTLVERGEVLYLSPEPVVHFRMTPRALGTLLVERFQWGRLFGAVRAERASAPSRLVHTVAAPLMPFLLFARHAGTQRRLGNGGRFARSAGRVLAMLVAWTAGEVAGTVTRRP